MVHRIRMNHILLIVYISIIVNFQGQGQYHKSIKTIEEDIQKAIKQVNELTGIKESDTGLAAPALWDLAADKQTLTNEQPLQVPFIASQYCVNFCDHTNKRVASYLNSFF